VNDQDPTIRRVDPPVFLVEWIEKHDPSRYDIDLDLCAEAMNRFVCMLRR
jgi:hypothetical protein